MKEEIINKEPVKIRFKELATGNKSIYLDIYSGGKRRYEFLKLYLKPEVGRDRRKIAKENAAILELATAIKAKRIVALGANKAGIYNKDNLKIKLVDFLDAFAQYKLKVGRSNAYSENILKVKKHLIAYRGDNVKMGEVDKEFCEGFIEYLKTAGGLGHKAAFYKQISQQSQSDYFRVFNRALNKAVCDGIIPENPYRKIESSAKIKEPESNRVYLELEEVKRMIATPCKRDDVKRAFLFSCFCGLRISDIRSLRWGDLKQTEKGMTLTALQQKTQHYVTYPLSEEAQKWLPERGKDAKDDDAVFGSLPKPSDLNRRLKVWAKDAKVDKVVSFHTARHTFGTMMLTLGADLYTTSKLMGHTKVTTTEIYAKIVDKKKDEAVGLIDKFFG